MHLQRVLRNLTKKLSEARANAVKNILVKTYKISAKRLQAKGMGATDKLFKQVELTVLLHSMITMQLNKEISSSDIWSCDQVLLNFGLGGIFSSCLSYMFWPPRFILFRQVILIR